MKIRGYKVSTYLVLLVVIRGGKTNQRTSGGDWPVLANLRLSRGISPTPINDTRADSHVGTLTAD